MIFIVKFEKCMANANILGIIISKFCYKKKLCLIILLKVDKGSKIGFYCIILFLNLVICLQIEGSREFLLNIKKII